MTDPNEFSDDDRKTLENATKLKIEVVKSDLTTLYAMFAAGNPPDVFRVQAAGLPQYISRKMVKNLQPYFAKSTLLKPDDLAPANNFYKWDGKQIGKGDLYGMVKDWSPDFTLFAYTKAFDDAGVKVPSDTTALTYDELRTLANKVTKVIRYLYDLAADGVNETPIDPSPNWMGADFNEGQIAILQYGYWFSAMAESDKTKGKTVMLPAPTWAGVRRDPTMTATGWVISSQTKDPDAAWAVFEQYMGGKPAQDRAKSGWGVPGLKSLYPQMPQQTDFQKQVQKVLQGELSKSDFILQFNPYIGEETFSTSWKKNLEPALKGTISFDKFVQNIESEVNTAIADGKRIIGG